MNYCSHIMTEIFNLIAQHKLSPYYYFLPGFKVLLTGSDSQDTCGHNKKRRNIDNRP